MNYLSIDKLGVAISTSLTGTNPIFAMIFGVFFLGEEITLSTVVGSVMVVVGVISISGGGKEGELRLHDILIPLASAFFYAASSAVRKVGLDILPESVLVAVVGALTSLVAYPILLKIFGRTDEFRLSRRAVPFLVAGGIATSTAWIGMFMATQQGSIGVVSAIIGASPLFSLILIALLLRDTERLSFRVVIGSLFIVIAVVLITFF